MATEKHRHKERPLDRCIHEWMRIDTWTGMDGRMQRQMHGQYLSFYVLTSWVVNLLFKGSSKFIPVKSDIFFPEKFVIVTNFKMRQNSVTEQTMFKNKLGSQFTSIFQRIFIGFDLCHRS